MRLRWLLPLVAAFALAGCSRAPLVFLSDRYWTLFLAESGARPQLAAAAAAKGYRLEIASIDPAGNVPEQLRAAVGTSRAATFLLSPLLSDWGSEIAAQFPRDHFIYFADGGGTLPSNATVLVSDPVPAFEQAGEWAARFVQSQSQSGGSTRSLCAVFAVAPRSLDAARSAFIKGYDRVDPRPSLHEIEVGIPVDRNAVRIFLNDARLKNPALYALLSPATDSYCLDLLNGNDTPLLVENWVEDAQYSTKVAFSVEEQVVPTLMKIVETLGPRADTRIRIPWRAVAAGGGASEQR